MKIILENVVKGVTVTGVAKIMDGAKNVNNVPFNVGTVEELDTFCLRLLDIQDKFKTVAEGEYVPVVKPEKTLTDLEKAEQKIYELKRKIELGVMKETDQEFVDAVAAYKLASSKK